MDESSPSPTRPWWLAWLGANVGGPLLAFLCVTMNREEPIMPLLGLGLVLNIPFSICLARSIATRRALKGQPSGSLGLSIGLMLAGWAVLGFSTFAGCMAAIMATNGHH